MLPILHFTNDPAVMGARFVNARGSKALCLALSLLVMVINVYLVGQFVADPASPVPHAPWFHGVMLAYAAAYFGALACLVPHELRALAVACGLAAAAEPAATATTVADVAPSPINLGINCDYEALKTRRT